MAVVVQMGVVYLTISPYSSGFFVASGPSELFPEPYFSPAPLSREWDFY